MKSYLNLICVVCITGLSFDSNPGTGEIYPELIFKGSQALHATSGIKSLLFNPAGTKLYALSLEGMCIYEFDRESKKILRKINFKLTSARGWDYNLHKSISSYAEMPVEACFSHHDEILWISLHNAGGIVPIPLDTLAGCTPSFLQARVAYVTSPEMQVTDTLYLPLVKTGQIPKVIAKTADDKFLMVSNWGSKSLSVLKISDTVPYGRKVIDIALPAIPRGIAIDEKNKKTYVAIMGGSKIAVISNKSWKIEKYLSVPVNPRHVVMDSSGRIFVSFNAISQVACFAGGTGKLLFRASTHLQPRTIALSANHRFLFVTCYGGERVDVFKINTQSFSKIYSFKCKGKPVGIDLYEDQDKLEAWVCGYTADSLNIFTFEKR